MFRIGLVIVILCTVAGGIFAWNWKENPVAVAPPVAPVAPPIKQIAGSVDFGPYMGELQRRIKSHWHPPKKNISDRIQVVFRVNADGAMSKLRLSTKSESDVANSAALKAVQDSAPLAALPKGAPDYVDIQFTFDYNVLKGHKRI